MKNARSLTLFVALLVSSFALSACLKKQEENAAVTPTPASSQENNAKPSSETDTTSKTVSVKGTYESPAGPEEVGISLKLDSQGIILDSTVEVMATAPMSKLRQSAFRDGLDDAVIGKKLSELTAIDRVGGSSLTTGAFNRALAELQQQAQM